MLDLVCDVVAITAIPSRNTVISMAKSRAVFDFMVLILVVFGWDDNG